MIGGLLVLAFVWTSAYAVGRSSRRRRRRDHRPRLLALVERGEPGGIDRAILRIDERDARARAIRDYVYPDGPHWQRPVPMPVAGPGRNRSG